MRMIERPSPARGLCLHKAACVILFTQLRLFNLSGGIARQLVEEVHLTRNRMPRDALLAVRHDVLGAQRGTGRPDDEDDRHEGDPSHGQNRQGDRGKALRCPGNEPPEEEEKGEREESWSVREEG